MLLWGLGLAVHGFYCSPFAFKVYHAGFALFYGLGFAVHRSGRLVSAFLLGLESLFAVYRSCSVFQASSLPVLQVCFLGRVRVWPSIVVVVVFVSAVLRLKVGCPGLVLAVHRSCRAFAQQHFQLLRVCFAFFAFFLQVSRITLVRFKACGRCCMLVYGLGLAVFCT